MHNDGTDARIREDIPDIYALRIGIAGSNTELERVGTSRSYGTFSVCPLSPTREYIRELKERRRIEVENVLRSPATWSMPHSIWNFLPEGAV